jgi:transposase InsO family protein
VPWRGLDSVELATLERIDWLNNRRLHGFCHNPPPAEFEDLYHHQHAALEALKPGEPSLR